MMEKLSLTSKIGIALILAVVAGVLLLNHSYIITNYITVGNCENDSKKELVDSLNDAPTDSKKKAEEIKKKVVILHKTKAQYAIY
jgi:hypothetical protein